MNRLRFLMILAVLCGLAACSGSAAPTPTPERLLVGVVLASSANDKGFSEYTFKGARDAAAAAGLDFSSINSQPNTFNQDIEQKVKEGADLVITVGFQMAEPTAKVARKYPAVKFAIVDVVYAPGIGCPETASDCYSGEGGLANVTSLVFAEDEVGYLAGVLGACMSKTGIIASVSGTEIPPVVRFVTGYQNGAKSVKPDIVTLNIYIPDFDALEAGKVAGQEFINKGADVMFAVGSNTGNGGLLAAKEAGIMGIGVDVDQYLTYPEVKEILLSSAKKNVDVATGDVVKSFAAGNLQAGIRLSTIASGGVGLAPYHDWDGRIPQDCKDRVTAAEAAIKANPTVTGAK